MAQRRMLHLAAYASRCGTQVAMRSPRRDRVRRRGYRAGVSQERLMRYAARAFPFVIALLIGAPRPGLSQARWSGELSGGAAFATQTLAGADLRTGGGFG